MNAGTPRRVLNDNEVPSKLPEASTTRQFTAYTLHRSHPEHYDHGVLADMNCACCSPDRFATVARSDANVLRE
jgi:hypothetical protein